MSTMLPRDPHDLALWLFDSLEGVQAVGGGPLYEGRLPDRFDFNTVVEHLEAVAPKLSGNPREDQRKIEFYPSAVGVYQDVSDLLAAAANRRRVPQRFTLRDVSFTFPSPEGVATPSPIDQYLTAIRVWNVLEALADVRNGTLLFISSHDSQLELRADLKADELLSLPSFARFASEFALLESHADQKRAIVRTVLIDQFKPRRVVTLGDVLGKFEAIAVEARQSLAMYMAEFSVAKVRNEVERQNLDDTLSLNRSLSDIQNQLLALPAAILLAGATIADGAVVRNYAVLVAVAVFSIFILIMASNQRHSVDAIAMQIQRRKRKVSEMPGDSATSVLPMFQPLEARVTRQRLTLLFICIVVVVVLALVAVAVVIINTAGTAPNAG